MSCRGRTGLQPDNASVMVVDRAFEQGDELLLRVLVTTGQLRPLLGTSQAGGSHGLAEECIARDEVVLDKTDGNACGGRDVTKAQSVETIDGDKLFGRLENGSSALFYALFPRSAPPSLDQDQYFPSDPSMESPAAGRLPALQLSAPSGCAQPIATLRPEGARLRARRDGLSVA